MSTVDITRVGTSVHRKTTNNSDIISGSVAEWFVRWTTKLAIRSRSRVAAGLPTGYSGLGGNLTGYYCQQYRPRLDNRGGNGTHQGLCWKQVVPSIPGGDVR